VFEDGVVRVPVRRHSGVIAAAVRRLDTVDVGIDDILLRRPTLDDVFLALTGHTAEESEQQDQAEQEEVAA
jgi:ABC-2 type transport system ATP-binding protein